jgi:hypothetical protein
MSKAKVLRTVTNRFSLFNDGRALNANKRNYVIKSVQDMIASAQTQELLRLGEAYGYYGHGNRRRANKLSLGETEVIMMDGKPVVVENVPSNRTVNITCSDDGIVEHTEEVLGTPSGRIVDSMIESTAGGWSWATGGRDTRAQSITRSYHGMDYVLQPNYLSLTHPSMMMESADQQAMMMESLQGHGFDSDSSEKIMRSMGLDFDAERVGELETELMYLESANADLVEKLQAKDHYGSMLLEALESLPVYITDAQRSAASRLGTQEDVEVLKGLFESVGQARWDSLPLGVSDKVEAVQEPASKGAISNEIRFEPSRPRFG